MDSAKNTINGDQAHAQTLGEEFSARMSGLHAEGLVDIRATISPDDQLSIASVVTTINNVLRLREEGKVSPLTFDI